MPITSDPGPSHFPPLRGRHSQVWQERLLLRRPKNWTKAAVYMLCAQRQRYVVKDQSHLPTWLRLTAGRWLIRREAEALRRLLHVPGVPDFIGWVDKDSFAMSYIEATPLSDQPGVCLPDAFFHCLTRLFDEIHASGVAHGDPDADNILLDATGRPYLVDFAVAQFNDGSVFGRWLHRQALMLDRRKLAKLKQCRAPHLLTDEDRAKLLPPRLHEAVRAVVRPIRRVLRRTRGSRSCSARDAGRAKGLPERPPQGAATTNGTR